MTRFWKRRAEGFGDLESELRASRPEPRPEFIRALAARVHDGVAPARRLPLRVALGGALTAVLLVALAAIGGLGYAATGAGHVIRTAERVAKPSGLLVPSDPPGGDQHRPGKGCGDENHVHERRFQCKVKVNDAKMQEGNSGTTNMVFTVSLNDFALSTVTVSFATADGTATTPSDYLPSAGVVTFAVGQQLQTVSVAIVGDTVKEQNETFVVNLSSPSDNAIIDDPQGLGTIQNDDK